MTLVVGVDGDDTLWHNERIFSMTEERFRSLVEPFAPGVDLDECLLSTERRNLSTFGYGVKSFALSMIETAIEVSNGRVPVGIIAELLDTARSMMHHPVELMDGVLPALETIASRYTTVLITKGDLFHQESKLARSGLLPYLHHIEIVSEKDDDAYTRALRAAKADPRDFVMIGDSVKSDIVPVLAIGGRAIHIPGTRVWELERASVDPVHSGRWWTTSTKADVPDLLTAIERDL